jgi:hypothetical protein
MKGGAIGHFDGAAHASALIWDSLALRLVKLGDVSQYWSYFEMF